MQFVQSALATDLYFADGDGRAARQSLYVLPAGTASPPASIAFANSWTDHGGAYFFLPAPLAAGTDAVFLQAAQSYLADPRNADVRFAWCRTPALPGLLSVTAIAAAPAAGNGYATLFAAAIPFGDLELVIPAGSPVVIDTAGASFSIGSAAVPFFVSAGWGAARVTTVGPSLTLPMTGGFGGALQFPLVADPKALAQLDVALRWFYALPPDPADPLAAAADFFLASVALPVFATALTLYAAMDPLAPLDPARTLLAFNAADAGLPAGAAAAAVASHYRSTLGEGVTLTPLTGAAAPTRPAALVLAARPAAGSGAALPALGPRDGVYLVPAGDFALTVGKGDTLMCGLSGVEYAALPSQTILTFHPGGNAFAPGFLPGAPPGADPLRPAVPPTTAYATLRPAAGAGEDAGVDYYAQPDRSVLYNYGGPGGGGVTMLAPVPVLAAAFGATAAPVPLLPYAGTAPADVEAARQLEAQVVSPVRRALLGSAAPSRAARRAGAPSSAYSTTPQGLLATYTAGASSWAEIVLAQSGTPPQKFRLTDVDGELLAAFRSNQLFLVISDRAAIAAYLQATNASVILGSADEPWTFNLDPAAAAVGGGFAWDALNTILIVKFSKLSIAQLAAQVSGWAYPATFNIDPAGTSARIARTIADAASGGGDFAAFNQAVSDPDWNGILVLNADAPISNLPPELAGLAAGIDQSRFYGHHLGIAVSKIDTTTKPGEIGILNSSVFGLIHYVAPQPLGPGTGDYAFQVSSLKVAFDKSQVSGFSATVDLQINALFGEPAMLTGPDGANGTAGQGGNVVSLLGLYNKQIVGGVAHESYTFQTPDAAALTFAIAGPTLNAVQITKGQFATVTQPVALTPTGASRTAGVVTVATKAPHLLLVGDGLTLSEVTDQSFDGAYTVQTVTGATGFTCAPAVAAPTPPPDAQSGGGEMRPTRTRSRFLFWGLLDFKALPGLDLFSFGREAADDPPAGLAFSNLAIEMDADTAAVPPRPTFTFNAADLAFDMASSRARGASLFEHFPLTLTGFVQAKAGTAPTDAGFMGVQTPLSQSALTFPWYALTFAVKLGSPGGLAAKVDFVATFAAAWSPAPGAADNGYVVFTGLKLPGSSGSSRQISLQGIFNVTFKTIELLAPANAGSSFILVLYGIGLKFLSLSFPPTGQVNFALFGDPGAPAGDTSLGWYAAYDKGNAAGGGGKAPALAPVRRLSAPANVAGQPATPTVQQTENGR